MFLELEIIDDISKSKEKVQKSIINVNSIVCILETKNSLMIMTNAKAIFDVDITFDELNTIINNKYPNKFIYCEIERKTVCKCIINSEQIMNISCTKEETFILLGERRLNFNYLPEYDYKYFLKELEKRHLLGCILKEPNDNEI